MIEVGKYYKATDGCGLVVKALSPEKEGTFYGEVVVAAKGHKNREWCDFSYFEPCEAPETTQPEPTPTKDVELRLECLKLAIITMDIKCPTGAIDEAEYFYDWITKPQPSNP
jgi:hypothetical protein